MADFLWKKSVLFSICNIFYALNRHYEVYIIHPSADRIVITIRRHIRGAVMAKRHNPIGSQSTDISERTHRSLPYSANYETSRRIIIPAHIQRPHNGIKSSGKLMGWQFQQLEEEAYIRFHFSYIALLDRWGIGRCCRLYF